MRNNLIHFSNPQDLQKSLEAEAGKFYYDTKDGVLYFAAKSHYLKEHPLLVNMKTGNMFSIKDGPFGDREKDFIEVEQPFEIKPQ